jgi:hypothetical protein
LLEGLGADVARRPERASRGGRSRLDGIDADRFRARDRSFDRVLRFAPRSVPITAPFAAPPRSPPTSRVPWITPRATSDTAPVSAWPTLPTPRSAGP